MHSLVHRTEPRSNRTYLRDSILAAFFFPPPVHECVDALREILDLYVASIPAGALTWSAVGANTEEWSQVTAKTIASCKALLRKEPAMKRRLTAFDLTDGQAGGDAPGYGVSLIAQPNNDQLLPESLCLLQMSFPMEHLTETNAAAFVATMRQVAEKLTFVCGYVSPCLRWSELDSPRGIEEAKGLAARHTGYDLQANLACRLRLGRHVRGARWLSFLGPDLVRTLGGGAAVRESLPEAIGVSPLSSGLMIQAGTLPEIGDANRAQGTPLLREVARVLEPVTQFGELAMLGQVFHRDTDALTRWERRFLD